jgi:insecticidal toxin complex protein TccC
MSWGFDAHTPQLTATDSRGLPVRQVAYWRQDLSDPEARLTLQQHDADGRLVAQRDPRLLADASAPANLVSIYSLSGKVLSTVSVDAGWRVGLSGEADQALSGWDGRGSQRSTEYDDQVRPIAVFEQAIDHGLLCTERFAYGGGDPAFSARNQCGRLIRHDDAAGTQLF